MGTFNPAGCYGGIDPGLSGAIAILRTPSIFDPHAGPLVELYPMPTVKVRSKRILDYPALWDLFEMHLAGCQLVAIESQAGYSPPGIRIGAGSIFSMGRGFGALEAFAHAAEVPAEYPQPGAWKKFLGVPKEKAGARATAERLFPGVELPKRKSADHAEALLLAEYARRRHAGQEGTQ